MYIAILQLGPCMKQGQLDTPTIQTRESDSRSPHPQLQAASVQRDQHAAYGGMVNEYSVKANFLRLRCMHG